MVYDDKRMPRPRDDNDDNGSVSDISNLAMSQHRDTVKFDTEVHQVEHDSDIPVPEADQQVERDHAGDTEKVNKDVENSLNVQRGNMKSSSDGALHRMDSLDAKLNGNIQTKNGIAHAKKNDHHDEIGDGEDNDDEENVDDENYPEAPDGGYAWVVLAGAFVHFMIYGGLGRCEGLYFLEFQSRFNTSAQLAAWPGALMAAVGFLMGPVCGMVSNRFSVRTGFMIGTIISVVGLMLTAYAPNVYVLFLSHTLLGGLGRGLMSCLIMLALYFDKHRSLAMGFSQSGQGIGSMWILPLTQYLFDFYGFQGAFLITAALALHGFLTGMIFRPLSMHHKFNMASRKKQCEKNGPQEVDKLTSGSESFLDVQIQDEAIKEENKDKAYTKLLHRSLGDVENSALKSQTSLKDFLKPSLTSRNNLSVSLEGLPAEPIISSIEALSVARLPIYPPPKSGKDGCLKSSFKILFPVEHKRKGSSKVVKTFHWDLLKNVPFMTFAVAMLFFLLAYKTAFTFIPAIAMERDLTEYEAALVLTICGAVDTFGRIALGFILNIQSIQRYRSLLFNSFLLILSVAVFLVPFMNSFATLSVTCGIFGLISGVFLSQKDVILMDYLGRHVLPSSLGIQKAFQGIGALIGPPIAGALKDSLGNFDTAFYLGGGFMLAAGILVVVSSVLFRVSKRKS